MILTGTITKLKNLLFISDHLLVILILLISSANYS